ncbi:hypothetical protein PSTG_17966, partial [Puccinia striiformis f. sp. tritici PST-78]
FSAIYNAIERNPPSGSCAEDWLKAANTIYAEQNKGAAFGSILAWQNLRHCPKRRPDSRPNEGIMPTFNTQSDITMDGFNSSNASFTASGFSTPAASPDSSTRPIGQKAAKKRRIDGYRDDEMLAAANEFASLAKDRLESLNQGNELLQTKLTVSQDRLKLKEKKFKVEEQHRLSEVQLNELKMLRESEDNLDDEAKEVVRLIKKQIKHKWLSSAI